MARSGGHRHDDGNRKARRFTALAAVGAMMAPLALAGGSEQRAPSAVVLAQAAEDAPRLVKAPDTQRQLGASGELPQAAQLSPDIMNVVRDGGKLLAGPLPGVTVPSGQMGIPGIVLAAYRKAEAALAASAPSCGLSWSVLAGIGRIESGHARGGQVYANGDTVGTILGPRLDGTGGTAAVPAVDHGRWTGDPVWDHAVGPMQFIASTWAGYGTGNPNNVFDAALAAGRYLCAGGGDLRDPARLAAAVFRYNHSNSYVATVLLWARAYASGVTPLPTPVPGGAPLVPVDTTPVGDAKLPLPPLIPPPVRPVADPVAPVVVQALPPVPDPGQPTSAPPSTTPPAPVISVPPPPEPPTSEPPVSEPPPSSTTPPPEPPPADPTTTTAPDPPATTTTP